MADGNLEIDTKINTDGVAEQVNKLSDKINKLSDNKTLTAFSKLGTSITGLQSAFSMVTGAVKKANAAVSETTALYRKQITAEKQLEQASKNNPYLDAQSVKQLKDYASYLQSISTTGDETLIPMMAQLASTGRTQAEIQNIMSAALDLSASGMMSLDSAVQQLNATYSGNVGLMGRQITELKDLTDEELKNGKAVDIISKKFKGMAEETAKATGSSEQLKNAWGDMKEEIGASFEKNLTPMRSFFTELISKWTEAKKARREYEESKEANSTGNSTTATLETEIAGLTQEIETRKQSLKTQQQSVGKNGVSQKNIDDLKMEIQLEEVRLAGLQKDLDAQKEAERIEKKRREEAEKTAAAQAEENDVTQKAIAFMNQNQAALDKQIEQIELEAKLKGEDVDQQEILNAYMQSYIDLVTGSDLVTENNSFSQKRLKELQDYAAGIVVTTDDYEKLKEQLDEYGASAQTSVIDSLKQQLENLDALAEKLQDFPDLYQQYADKRIEIENAITQAQKESLAEQMTNLSNYMNQYNELTSSITDMIRTNNEEQADSEQSELAQQYNDGLISYEDYCEKKEEISKKSAQEEYKLKLWEWTSNLLTATANVAQGVSSALATGTMAEKIINTALVAASGAVQIATITANKPVAPSFATGGVVQGGNFNDGITAHISSGEMILNSAQQMNLWKAANTNGGTGGSNVTMPVTINNNTSANVSTKMDKNGLMVIIDDIVNSSMQAGKYTQSMNVAQSRANGATYY